MRTGPDHNSTENDEFIARALAEEELGAERLRRQQQQQQQQSQTFTYPGDRLRQQQAYSPQPYPGHQQQQQSAHPSSYTSPPFASHDNGSNMSPFGFPVRRRTPMCHIPCVVGPNSVCVEM